MKCPYCGADVVPDTKCEYCGSFVEKEEKETDKKKEYSEILGEFIYESAEHLAEGLRNAANNANYSSSSNNSGNANNAKDYEETIKRVSSPENKRTLKKLLITLCVIIIIPVICYVIFLFYALWSSFSVFDDLYGTDNTSEEITSTYNICSLTDQKATVKQFDDDGSMVLAYEGREYHTILKDDILLSWLNNHSHTLEGVGVLFTTDSEGDVISLAMSSETFYVLSRDGENYMILRNDQVFSSTSDVPLEVGNFYDGYFNYPNLNAHAATDNAGNGYSHFAPNCDAKEMQTFQDSYTDAEYSLPMIYMDDTWFHCSQKLYDACTEGKEIPVDILVDKTMGVIYSDE